MNGPNKVAKLVAIQGKMGMTWCQSLLIWARTTPKNWAQKKKKKNAKWVRPYIFWRASCSSRDMGIVLLAEALFHRDIVIL